MNPANERKRVYSLDFMRIVAAFGIVALHAAPQLLPDPDVTTASYRALTLFTLLFRWCVPVFFMISGALFLNPARELSTKHLFRRSIPRIAVSYVLWASLYALINCAMTGRGMWTFLNQFLRGHYHLWYLQTILGLYLLTPLLRRITHSLRLTGYFLLLLYVFSFAAPRIVSFVLLLDVPHRDVILSLQAGLAQINPVPGEYAVFYFLLGYYLTARPPQRQVRRLLYLSLPLCYALCALLTFWQAGKTGQPSGTFFEYTTLAVSVMAAAVFVFFTHHFAAVQLSHRAAQLVRQLSACSFVVYLVHPLILQLLPCPAVSGLSALLAAMPAFSLAVFILSVCVFIVLRRVPGVRRIL